MSVKNFGKFPGFEMIGLSIPIMENLFTTNTKEKILTVLKGALIMYILYKFMDEIPTISSQLIGGSGLPRSSEDGLELFKKFAAFARAAQKRVMRGGKKLGSKALDSSQNSARSALDRGKSQKEHNASSKTSLDQVSNEVNSPSLDQVSKENNPSSLDQVE
jgi:hypothetical protein